MKKAIYMFMALTLLLGASAYAEDDTQIFEVDVEWKENFNGYKTGSTPAWKYTGDAEYVAVTEYDSEKNKVFKIVPDGAFRAEKQFAPVYDEYILDFKIMITDDGNCDLSFVNEDFCKNYIISFGPESGIRFEANKFVNLVFSVSNGAYTLYLDGEAVKNGTTVNSCLRGLSFEFAESAEYCLDDIRVYTGNVIYPEYELLTMEEKLESKLSDAIVLYIGINEALNNGKFVAIDSENTDVKPVVIDGRTFVPVRFVSETFGAAIEWDEESSHINIKYDSTELVLTIGSTSVSINGDTRDIEAPPYIKSGRTMVPIRILAEAFEKKVFWKEPGLIVISDEEKFSDSENAVEKELIARLEKKIDRLKTYTVDGVNYLAATDFIDEEIVVENVWATDDDGNIPENAIDNNTATRWSAEFDQSITFDFGETKYVSYMAVLWKGGDTRRSKFNIEISNDNLTWEKIYEGKSSGVTADYEITDINSNARYVRYVGHGYDGGSWNSVCEVKFFNRG